MRPLTYIQHVLAFIDVLHVHYRRRKSNSFLEKLLLHVGVDAALASLVKILGGGGGSTPGILGQVCAARFIKP